MERSRSSLLAINRLHSEICPELNMSHVVVSRSLYCYFEVDCVSKTPLDLPCAYEFKPEAPT